jgi:hypothetical protein
MQKSIESLLEYLSEKELQQDISARLTLLETHVHSRTKDGTFNIYRLKGK